MARTIGNGVEYSIAVDKLLGMCLRLYVYPSFPVTYDY